MEMASSVPALKSARNNVRISIWNCKQLALLNNREQDELRFIIDSMGLLSAQAQHLRIPITDYNRLRTGNHTLYLSTSGIPGKPDYILVKGMLKVGVKNLYIRKDNGQLVEMAPLCVLDFCVHEKFQRLGLGHELFEAMLQHENKLARELAQFHINDLFYTAKLLRGWGQLQTCLESSIDRPSTKLHSFMAKHYNLREYLPQANQFVVFRDYFGEQQNSNHAKCNPTCDYSKETVKQDSTGSSYNSRKVLHGRRANKNDMPNMDPSSPAKLTEQTADKNYLYSTTIPPSDQMQRPSRQGRRPPRHHVADNVDAERESGRSNMVDTQKTPDMRNAVHSPCPISNDLKTQKAPYPLVEQTFPRNEDSKVRRGRGNPSSTTNGSHELKQLPEVGYPHSLPFAGGDSQRACNPPKLPRRETTRARNFSEDQTDLPNVPQKSVSILKYPYWTEDSQSFQTTYKNSKIELAHLPPSFQMTRSCYHAGMQGHGAAEAMGYHNRVVRQV